MSALSLNDLIDYLTDIRDSLDDDTADVHVRVAYQRSYPLRGTVVSVATNADIHRDSAYEDGVPDDEIADGVAAEVDSDGGLMVWLALGEAPYDENPYAPRNAWTNG